MVEPGHKKLFFFLITNNVSSTAVLWVVQKCIQIFVGGGACSLLTTTMCNMASVFADSVKLGLLTSQHSAINLFVRHCDPAIGRLTLMSIIAQQNDIVSQHFCEPSCWFLAGSEQRQILGFLGGKVTGHQKKAAILGHSLCHLIVPSSKSSHGVSGESQLWMKVDF